MDYRERLYFLDHFFYLAFGSFIILLTRVACCLHINCDIVNLKQILYNRVKLISYGHSLYGIWEMGNSYTNHCTVKVLVFFSSCVSVVHLTNMNFYFGN